MYVDRECILLNNAIELKVKKTDELNNYISRGMGWGGRWEGGSGWGAHVNPRLIHISVWQKPLQKPLHCKVISLQLIKINEEK